MSKPTSSTPSLKQLALDAIGKLADAVQKTQPTLTRAQAVTKAAQTPEGKSAYNVYRMPGAEQPFTVVLAHLAKGEGFLEQGSMRDHILAKRAQLAKEGGSGGSGPRGGNIENPIVTGYRGAPAASLPAQPNGRKVKPPISGADAILADIHGRALRAAPDGTSQEAATAAFLKTPEGQGCWHSYNTARQAES